MERQPEFVKKVMRKSEAPVVKEFDPKDAVWE
jgi:hypothetical protein